MKDEGRQAVSELDDHLDKEYKLMQRIKFEGKKMQDEGKMMKDEMIEINVEDER